jgi:uncharacterized protein (TIGR00290 family)
MSFRKAVFNWSGGKDSALALHKTIEAGDPSVSCLLTTVNEIFGRVSMHGVRTELLERQAEQIGIPLVQVKLPEMPDMPTYEKLMLERLLKLTNDDIGTAVFGDIFLDDLRKYREDKLSTIGMNCLFPIWKISTRSLIEEFMDLGFKAITVCVDEKHLDRSFVGRAIDRSFIDDLPSDVDPCGENGEYHSFVYDGPIFKEPVLFKKGDIVYRKYSRSQSESSGDANVADPFDTGFWYCDLLPV